MRHLDRLSKSYSFSCLLFALWIAKEKAYLMGSVYFILLHIIIYTMGRRAVWVNFALFYAPLNIFPYSLLLLAFICLRRYDFAGALVGSQQSPQLLFTIPGLFIMFLQETKLIKFGATFIPTFAFTLYKNRLLPQLSLWNVLGLPALYTAQKRWKHTMNDEWIDYREKVLSIFIDSLLIPQIFNPQGDWKLLAVLACLLVRVRYPLLVVYLACVHLNPMDLWHSAPATFLIIRSYKGYTGEFERQERAMVEFARQMRLYQKVNQGLDYEKPPVEFDDVNQCSGWHLL